MNNYETVWLKTTGGMVEAWYLSSAADPSTERMRPVVMYAHGNGELIDQWVDIMTRYCTFGISVLLVEYPGYGRSDGKPSEKTITETFVHAYDWLVNSKGYDPAYILGHGRSIGGGAICALARQRTLRALIVESTFTSVRQFAKNYGVPSFLIKDPFDNMAVLRSYPGPVLLMHGTRDTIVPYTNSVILARAARNAQLVTFECNHNDCPPDWDVYWSSISEFICAQKII